MNTIPESFPAGCRERCRQKGFVLYLPALDAVVLGCNIQGDDSHFLIMK